MIDRISFITATLLAAVVRGSQPTAPSPIAAPLRELPWAQLNFLHTTDSHGWHAGHLQEPSYAADWGDYISFAHHLRTRAASSGTDLLVIDTGDRVEGAGLYDASHPKGNYTFPILAHQHIDVITSGNHELYKARTSDEEYTTTVPNFRGNYIASNIDIISPTTGERVPLAARFRKFTTKHQKIRILAFGFLFDFTDNANNTFVQPVEETVKEDWFQDAIRDRDLDLILVAGHVAAKSKEYTAIFKAVRQARWDTPIAFFAGHTHIRDVVKYDDKAFAIESGRYMETVGFMSIDGLSTAPKVGQLDGPPPSPAVASPKFQRRYIDANLYSYHHHTHLNSSTFPTASGTNVSAYIARARSQLDLDRRYGCAPHDYWLNRAAYPGKDSVISLLESHILPAIIRRHHSAIHDDTHRPRTKLVLTNTGALRFDIFRGPLTRDALFTISPFTSGFRLVRAVPLEKAKLILPLLNSEGSVLNAILERSTSELAPPQQMALSRDIPSSPASSLFEPPEPRKEKQAPLIPPSHEQEKPDLPPGYTTHDALGTDGDDTVHAEIAFYRVPNCVQAFVSPAAKQEVEVAGEEKVDLVFNEFITPWVLKALEFLGLEVTGEDVHTWGKGVTLTEALREWVQGNWEGEC